jgi:hypothetical protein
MSIKVRVKGDGYGLSVLDLEPGTAYLDNEECLMLRTNNGAVFLDTGEICLDAEIRNDKVVRVFSEMELS